jgi:hypothetical protein
MNLDKMTLEELNKLKNNVIGTINKITFAETEKNKKAFLTSKSAEIRNKIHELRKTYKVLSETEYTITISAKLTLKIDTDDDFENLFSQESSSPIPEDIFGVSLESELLNRDLFSREMIQEIDSRLDDALRDVCFEAVRLKPDLYDSLHAFSDELSEISDELEKYDLDNEQLQDLFKPIKLTKKKSKK